MVQDNKDDSILCKAYPRVRCSRQLCATAGDGSLSFGIEGSRARCRRGNQDRQFHLRSARTDDESGNHGDLGNNDDIPHLVSEKDGKFRSSALDTGDKFSQTFSTAGTVEYFCAIHPHMTGKIVVEP